MSSETFMYNDCCLLTNIDLNSERIYRLLERRFESNSNSTSFDFKSLLPEQLSNNAKVSRSLLRYQPKLNSTNNNDEENLSSDSISSTDEDDYEVTSNNDNDDDNDNDNDDYLDKLARWEPENFRPMIETDDEDENNDQETMIQSIMIETDNENHQINYSTSITMIQRKKSIFDKIENLAFLFLNSIHKVYLTRN